MTYLEELAAKNPGMPAQNGLLEACREVDRLRAQVGDLATMTRRLARALRKESPDSELPALATEMLQRHGRAGSALRSPRGD